MDSSHPERFVDLPQSSAPHGDFVRFDRKIIPITTWKDGRIRADLSKYGKGVLVSRNRANLAKRIREVCADLDDLAAEVENSVEPVPRIRNRHSAEIRPAPAPDDLDFIRPADYRGEFSNCPRHVDRMIGPTHLQKRLFGFLWAGAKFSGLKSHKLILAEAARELGATDRGIKKAAEQLRDEWNLIWFERTSLGRGGWAEIKFPRPFWMPKIPNSVRDCTQYPNAEHSSANPEENSRNPEQSSAGREGESGQRIRKKREREKHQKLSFSSREYGAADF